MARTTGPLMSLDASGSVAKTLTFSKWKGRNYVRQLVIPSNPNSGGQRGQRSWMRFLTIAWSAMGAIDRAAWDDLAAQHNFSPFNAYVSANLLRISQGLCPSNYPGGSAGAAEAAPTATAATALVKAIKLTWTDSVGASDWGTQICWKTSAGVTMSNPTTVFVQQAGIQEITITGLTTGQAYYFNFRGFDIDGNFGTTDTERNATAL